MVYALTRQPHAVRPELGAATGVGPVRRRPRRRRDQPLGQSRPDRQTPRAARRHPGALRAFNLLIDERPTQAAVVAFARQPLPWYPQCTLRLARFRGLTKTEFLDQERVTGHAFPLLQRADRFIRKHISVAGTFVPGKMERQDKPLYPPLALREALVNAFCHRDDSVTGGSVSVAIFDDRLEVASTGSLPDGLTPDDLRQDHPSIPRNPLLAQLFYQQQ